MDIFKFKNPVSPTRMEQGEILNGFSSKLWVERYRNSGEFTLVAPSDSGMREKLPIGTFVSHMDTVEVMIVENHEINDNKGSESEIVITGRGFETFLENRIVGSNKNFPISATLTDFTINAAFTWDQAVILIGNHILATSLLDDNYEIPYVSVLDSVTGSGDSVARTVARGPLYDALIQLLSIDNLGIKVIRPGPWSPLSAGSPNLALLVHKGVDRTAQVIFTVDSGEIESADYLWSNKNLKNAALVTGKWVETVVNPAAVGYNRRMMFVNATDIDEAETAPPSGAVLTTIVNAMQQRGLEALAAQTNVTLTKAEVSKEATKAIFRKDFDVGDLITVSGDYNQVSKMRVSEYVETEDFTGQRGSPTLTMDEGT
jgi:hypothetical protein